MYPDFGRGFKIIKSLSISLFNCNNLWSKALEHSELIFDCLNNSNAFKTITETIAKCEIIF